MLKLLWPLGTMLLSQGGRRPGRQLFKTHSCALLHSSHPKFSGYEKSNDELGKTFLEAKCKNAHGKFEYI